MSSWEPVTFQGSGPPQPDTSGPVSWSDYGNVAAGGAESLASDVGSLVRHQGEGADLPATADLGKFMQQYFGGAEQAAHERLSPAAKARFEAGITSKDFWEHPVSASMLKATGMAPALVTALLPGGVIGDAVWGARVAAGAFGLMGAGGVTNEIYKMTDDKSDKDLQKESPYYAALRLSSDEDTARKEFNDKLLGAKPLIAGLVNAALGYVGPVAGTIRGLSGGAGALGATAERGILGRATLGGLEGAGVFGAQSGTSDVLGQQAKMEAGQQKDFDMGELVKAVLSPETLIGGGMGAVTGITFKGKGGKEPPHADEELPPQPLKTSTTGATLTPPLNEIEAAGRVGQPTPVSRPLDEQARLYPKTNKQGEGTGVKIEEAPVLGPNQDEAAAIAARQTVITSKTETPKPQEVPSEQAPVPPQPEQTNAPVAPPPVQRTEPPVQPPGPVPNATVPAQPTVPPQAEAGQPGHAVAHIVPARTGIPKVDQVLDMLKSKLANTVINSGNDVPFGAGASKSSDIVNVDKNVPPTLDFGGKTLDVHAAVAIHETVEHQVMQAMMAHAKRIGMKLTPADMKEIYNRAHIDWATPAERAYVESVLGKAGWKRYTDMWDGVLDHTEHENPANPPKDLYLDPYPVQERLRLERDGVVAQGAEQGVIPTEKVATGRILESKGNKEVNKEAQKTWTQQLGEGVGKMRAEEKEATEGRVSHKGKAVEDAREQNDTLADKIVAEHLARPVERPPTTNADLAATRDRLALLAKEVKESGVKVPEKVGYEGTSNSLVYLRDALDLGKSLASKGFVGPEARDRVVQFLVDEHAARQGDYAPLRERRRTVGEQMKSKAGTEGAQKRAEAKIAGLQEEPNDVRGIGAGREVTFEGIERQKASEVRKPTLSAEEKARYEAMANRGISPSETPRGWEKVEGIGEPSTREGDIYTNHDGVGARAIATGTAANALDKISPSVMPTSVSRALLPSIIAALKKSAGNARIHVLSRLDFEKVFRPPPGFIEAGRRAMGFYDMDTHEIVLPHDLFDRSDAIQQTIILHEIAHGATVDAIEADKVAKAQIRALMDELLGQHGDTPLTDLGLDTESTLRDQYGFVNEREFIAETLANPWFKHMLNQLPVSPELAARIGMKEWKAATLWKGVVDIVRRMFGLPANAHTALEAALSLGERAALTKDVEGLQTYLDRRGAYRREQASAFSKDIDKQFDRLLRQYGSDHSPAVLDTMREVVEHPADAIRDVFHDVSQNTSVVDRLRTWGRALMTNDQLAQGTNFKKAFPKARDWFDLLSRQGVLSTKLKRAGDDLGIKLIKFRDSAPGLYDKFADLMNRATMLGVDPIARIGEGRNERLAYSKAFQKKLDNGAALEDIIHEAPLNNQEALLAHEGLHAEFSELASRDSRVRGLLNDSFNFFRDAQNAMSRGYLKNILSAHDIIGDELERRTSELHDARTISADDRIALEKEFGKDTAKQLLQAKRVSVGDTPYIPLMRRGEWVTHGTYSVRDPTNTIRKTAEDTWEFATRKEASGFAQGDHGLHSHQEIVYYEPGTNNRVKKEEVTTAGNPEARYEVQLQRGHVEFHPTRGHAEAARDELRKSGLMDNVHASRRAEYEGREDNLSQRGFDSIIKRLKVSDEYKRATPASKRDLENALREASVAQMAGNRVQSRRLPRRRVQGASTDLISNIHEYNSSQANYRAKQEFRPQIDAALGEMRDYEKSMRGDELTTYRSEMAKEIEDRMRATDPNEYTGRYTEWSRRFATWSYVDRMMRASHLLLHQTHLPMITIPYIAGRHGLSAYNEMQRMWRQAGGAIYGAAGKDVWTSAFDTFHRGVNYNDEFKKLYASAPDARGLFRMWDHLYDLGLTHPEAGMEVQRFVPSANPVPVIDPVLNKLDLVFRHATNGTEAINRFIGTAVAYRLEFAKQRKLGKTEEDAHNAATNYARDVLANTQGHFVGTNAAPLYKNKYLRPFMQFRQFPQMMYHLIVKTAIRAFKGDTREERVQAASSLLAVIGSHVAMTGLLGGLPLEIAKVAGLISHGLGLTDNDWTDVEQAAYKAMSKQFGAGPAELIMHGLSREAGLDLHHRLGLNSFFTFGLPDKTDKASINSYLFQAALGAPYGLAEDAGKGINKMMEGNLAEGAVQAFPLQALRDIYKAWGGQPSAKSNYKYNSAERVARAVGFTPTGEADYYERSNQLRRQVHDFGQKRNQLLDSWSKADPDSKAGAWKAIQKWNADQQPAARITLKNAQDHAKRQDVTQQGNQSMYGVKFNKRTKGMLEDARQMYGVGQ